MTRTVKEVEEKVEVVRTQAERPQRKVRKPFGVPRSKLSVAFQIPGYHLHWINDAPGRIHEAVQGDYEFVAPNEVGEEGSSEDRVKRLVGTNEDGSAQFAYLMKIRQEWYEEDQAAGQAVQDQIDAAISQGKLEQTPGDGRYVPEGGISLRTK